MFQEGTYSMRSMYAVTKFKIIRGKLATVCAKQNYSKKADKQILQITHDEKSNLC